jgi:hypothetical protein
MQELVPSLERMAADAAPPATLRIAAIGSLGRAGQPQASAELRDIARGQDQRLAPAASVVLASRQTEERK